MNSCTFIIFHDVLVSDNDAPIHTIICMAVMFTICHKYVVTMFVMFSLLLYWLYHGDKKY